MFQTMCFDVVCLKNAMHFWDLNHSSGLPIWHKMSTLAPLSDFSYNAIRLIFHIFIHNGSVKKNCQVSALYLIPVKFGVQLKFDWTNLHEFFMRYSVVNSPSAVWVTPYPHPYPQIFGSKIPIFDFAMSSYLTSKLSTDVLYLLSV